MVATVKMSYSLPILHVLLAHFNQDSIKFMIKHELLTHGSNAMFDPSGFIECDACRMFKSQSLEKGARHAPISRRLLSVSPDLALSEIPADILTPSTFVPLLPLDLVHTDGFQFDFPSGRKLYFFIFIDHVTDYRMVYSVPSRAEFLTVLQSFHAFCFFYHKTNIKGLRMDNAGEMSSEDLYNFARFHGIHIQRCSPYDHHQNGVAERAVRTAEEAALTMLHHAGLSVQMFIAYAVINATQIRNKCVTSKSKGRLTTPHELFIGVKPKVEDLHPTGEVCFAYIKKDERKRKYDPKAMKCLFLCEDFERKAYVLMNVNTRTVVTSRDVRFPRTGASLLHPGSLLSPAPESDLASDENNIANSTEELSSESRFSASSTSQIGDAYEPHHALDPPAHQQVEVNHDLYISELAGLLARTSVSEPSGPPAPPTPILTAVHDEDHTLPVLQLPHSDIESVQTSDDHVPTMETTSAAESSEGQSEGSNSRVPHIRKKNSRYFNQEFVNVAFTSICDAPTSYKKAMASPEKDKWSDACKAELESLQREGTWQLVPRTKRMFVVRSKWVFKLKFNERGEVVRHKARLVAMGFTQTLGVNYMETYSPVLQAATRRLIFCLASDPAVTSVQADVETAFLQANLDREIYLEVPPGLEAPDDHVLRLHKAIYGLKQSPLLWYLTASEFFLSIGFKKCVSDVCLFIFTSPEGVVMLSIYVDDLTISSKSKSLVDWVLSMTKRRFPIRDVLPLSWTVGIHVESQGDTLKISQKAYIQSVFIVEDSERKERRTTPMAADIHLNDTSSEFLSRPDGVKWYQKIIGSLNYAAHSSRPDIAFSVNLLSRYLQKPREIHLLSAKRILIYLFTTADLVIFYRTSDGNSLFAYSDASLVSKDTVDGKSTTGYCVFFNGNLVIWKSVRQTTVSLSTMESELVAISTALIALQQVRGILCELGVDVAVYTIHTDSLPAIKYLTSSGEASLPRTRHLALRFHFVKNEVASGVLKLQHVSSVKQVADILTKPLPYPIFNSLRKELLGEPT